MRRVQKACPCVLKQVGTAWFVLVFRHPIGEDFQIPKGTVEADEPIELAVLRELEEESGIADASVGTYIGQVDRPVSADVTYSGKDEIHEWHLYEVLTDAELPDTWDHIATGSPEEEGLVFSFSWHPLGSTYDGFRDIFIKTLKAIESHTEHVAK